MYIIFTQFALTMLLGTLISIPFMIAKEGAKWGEFVTTFNTNPIVSFNLIASGEFFFLMFSFYVSGSMCVSLCTCLADGCIVWLGHVQRQFFCWMSHGARESAIVHVIHVCICMDRQQQFRSMVLRLILRHICPSN